MLLSITHNRPNKGCLQNSCGNLAPSLGGTKIFFADQDGFFLKISDELFLVIDQVFEFQ